MIPVTKSFLPPIEAYIEEVQRAYDNQWLTNRGELVKELEAKLKKYLGVSNVIAMTNGTLPLQIALKLLGKGGEIITTPFSYVATTAAIIWENCTPVFVDIHPEYLTIDETKIEAAITDKTTCILATHVYGNPCHIEEIERIAQKHNLKVIYDAAHCFGVDYKGKSIFEYGDISTCSFHATKLFHTGEGGALFCKDEKVMQELFFLHNFGHNGYLDYNGVGINAKMSELQAAMGLSVLPFADEIILKRRNLVNIYDSNLDFLNVRKLKIRTNTKWNNSYYPIIFKSENSLLKTLVNLEKINVFPRRYFFPSLNTLNYVDYKEMPISENTSQRIFCLPLFFELSIKQVIEICLVINNECVNE